jgi:hypothetical protein
MERWRNGAGVLLFIILKTIKITQMKTLIKLTLALSLFLSIPSCTKEVDSPITDRESRAFEAKLSQYSVEFTDRVFSNGRVSAITIQHVLSNRGLVVIVEQKLYSEDRSTVIDEAPRTIYNGYFNQLDAINIVLYDGYDVFIQVTEKDIAAGHIDGLEYRGYSDIFIADMGVNTIPMHWSTQQSLIIVSESLVDQAGGAPVLSVYESCSGTSTGIDFGPFLYDLTLNKIAPELYAIYLNELDRGYHIKYTSIKLASVYGKKACSVFLAGHYHQFSEIDINDVNFDPTALDSLIIEGTVW